MTTHEHDDVARRARAQRVALFRYQLICPALDPGLSSKARGRVVRAIATQTHTGPFGGQCCYSRDTLDRWIRRYRVGGFDALTPSIRQPGSRIDTTALELAVALKRENPERTAAQVARILRASSGWAPSESTLLRLFHRRAATRPTSMAHHVWVNRRPEPTHSWTCCARPTCSGASWSTRAAGARSFCS